jgi:hypothetical protein
MTKTKKQKTKKQKTLSHGALSKGLLINTYCNCSARPLFSAGVILVFGRLLRILYVLVKVVFVDPRASW